MLVAADDTGILYRYRRCLCYPATDDPRTFYVKTCSVPLAVCNTVQTKSEPVVLDPDGQRHCDNCTKKILDKITHQIFIFDVS